MKPQFPFKVFPSTHNKRLSLFDSILCGGPLGFHLAYWFRISEESFFLLSSAEATFDSRLIAFNLKPFWGELKLELLDC